LTNSIDAVVEVPKDRWLASAMYHADPARPGRMNTRWGGFLDHIDRFDAQFFGISPREAAPADPQQRLLLEVAYEATEDAGITMASLAGKRAGVYVGIGSYDYGIMQMSDRVAIDAYTNHGSSLCIAANRISYFFNLNGPSLAVDTACSSSLVAVDLACQNIWNGDTELAFAAGVNVIARPHATVGFSKASMLSPDGRCKTFDARANGFVRGEGAAVVILKPLAKALADRDRIYAVIRATAVNQDGRTEGISVPSQVAQEANLREALRLASIAPESVQYVEAHGTGTPVGDPIEAAAIGAVYGKAQRPEDLCVIGSMKTNIGHLEAASGMAGLIKTALCLQHRQIPPTLHFETPNPQIPFDDLRLRVAQRLEPWPETYGQPARAGVNSFGFGGTNAHAILEAPPAVVNPPDMAANRDDGCAWILPLSARSAAALPDVARSYLAAVGDDGGSQEAALRDICFSAGVKRSHHEFRLTLVAHDKSELREQLEAFLRGETTANGASGHASAGFSKPVFVCSGMGQQWWAMGRELLEQEPVYRRALEEVNDLFSQIADWSLLDKLTADEKTSQIQETRFGQPAIFALQVGLAALWRSWGVEPAAVLGHSAGEMAASYIAGALSLEDAVRVTYHRSRLQQQTAGQGVMLAVGISASEAARLVERHPRRQRDRCQHLAVAEHVLSRRVGRRQREELGRGHGPLPAGAGPDEAERRAERDQCRSGVGRMHDVARPAAEDRVEGVLARDRITSRSAVLEALEAVPVVPAPGTLADVTGQRRGVADLRRRYALGRLGEHRILTPDLSVAAERIERHEPADRHTTAGRGLHLIEPLDGLQADEDIRCDEPVLHHPEQIAAATGKGDALLVLTRPRDDGNGVRGIARVDVGEGFHARTSFACDSAATILSRVIGRSFIRTPIALATALATAAGAGTLLDSPMLFAPNGP
jgi:acyl transferase domain-containing protein